VADDVPGTALLSATILGRLDFGPIEYESLRLFLMWLKTRKPRANAAPRYLFYFS